MVDLWHPAEDDCRTDFERAAAVIAQQGYHKIECPHCQQGILRVYFRDYPSSDELAFSTRRRGTCWLWCSHCHTFLYFTGWLPEWWPESDPIPEVRPLYPHRVDVDAYWDVILRATSGRSGPPI
jgi:hypothetical protein